MTNIGEEAFYSCTGLTSIIIPESVTSIGDEAFRGCSGLTSIVIPNASVGNKAFYECKVLSSVTIGNSAGNSAVVIGNEAFAHCTNITSLTLGNSVTSIGNAAFYNCFLLLPFTIPNSVTSIGDEAFAHCCSFYEITIPSSVTNIGRYAFYECGSLVTNLATTPQKIEDGTFTMYNGFLHVLPGCKAAYEAADYWKNFTIVEDAKEAGTTGVADIETDNGMKDGKYLIDGKVVIVRNGKKYNLNGIAE